MTMRSPFGRRRLNLLCTVGAAGLTGALFVAHTNPASEYELSIYAATPIWFWIGVSVAFTSALVTSFTANSRQYRFMGLFLGGLASASIVSLPIIRGYYLHGIHDSVTHVGYVRELAAGTMTPFDLLYPGIHSVATFINGLTGFHVWRSLLLVPAVIVVLYYVFVSLTAREILDTETATTVGAFSAYLLLPVHLLANTLTAHPSSQTILYAPVILFVLIRYLRDTDSRRRFASPLGILLLIVVFASILYHPQQALNVLILLSMISVVQFLASAITGRPWAGHRRVYAVTGLSVLAYFAWTLHSPTVFAVAEGAVESVRGYFVGSAPEAGSSVASQTSSLQAIGVDIWTIYMKLFFVNTIFVVLTVAILLAAFADRLNWFVADVHTIRYLGIGLLAMLPLFVFYFVGDVAAHYFRQAGFMMMIGTVLGAVTLAYVTSDPSNSRFRTGTRQLLIVSFMTLLVFSTLVIHSSPYVYHANQHVTEARVSGYDLAFEMTNDSAAMAGIRQKPERYYEALVDMNGTRQLDDTVNSTEIGRLQERKTGSWYLMMHSNTYEREIRAYKEYRYTQADLEGVGRQVGIDLVHSNGDAELYYVR